MHIKRFFKAKELAYLEDNINFKFKEEDVNYIESLYSLVDDYMDLFYDIDSGELNKEKYENEYPNLREFDECFKKFMSKLYIKEMTYSEFILTNSSDDGFDIYLPDSDSD